MDKTQKKRYLPENEHFSKDEAAKFAGAPPTRRLKFNNFSKEPVQNQILSFDEKKDNDKMENQIPKDGDFSKQDQPIGIPLNSELGEYIKNAVEKGIEAALQKMKPKKNTTKEEKAILKKEAVGYSVSHGTNKAAENFNVNERTIRRWKKQQTEIDSNERDSSENDPKNTIVQKKRTTPYPKLEENLLNWFKEQRANKKRVTMKMIRARALEINKELNIPGTTKFKASIGWFSNFLRRQRITRRAATHAPQKLCEEFNEEIGKFIKDIKRLRTSVEILLEIEGKNKVVFFNVDQTPVFFHNPSYHTLNEKGKKSVEVLKSLGEKKRCTFMLTVSSNGIKLPPYIIFKSNNIKPIENKWKDWAIIRHNSNGWITEALMIDWANRILLNLKINPEIQIALILDRCPAHMGDKLKSLFASKNIPVFFIPPGCTGLLQPLDVSINKPFKEKLYEKIDDWFLKFGTLESNVMPKSKNIKSPTYENMIEWSLNAWNEMDDILIEKSFKATGITNHLLGKENHMISSTIKEKIDLYNIFQKLLTENLPSDLDDCPEIKEQFEEEYDLDDQNNADVKLEESYSEDDISDGNSDIEIDQKDQFIKEEIQSVVIDNLQECAQSLLDEQEVSNSFSQMKISYNENKELPTARNENRLKNILSYFDDAYHLPINDDSFREKPESEVNKKKTVKEKPKEKPKEKGQTSITSFFKN